MIDKFVLDPSIELSIIIAAQEGDLKTLKLLLCDTRRTNIEISKKTNIEAMLFASTSGYYDIVQLLLCDQPTELPPAGLSICLVSGI
jgi:hypothetical protein